MKKATSLFALVTLIVIGVNIHSYSQPATRSVGQRAIPKLGRDRRTAKVVTPPEIAIINNQVLVRETCPGDIVATMLDDGDVFVGWRIRNPAEQVVGEGIFYTKSLQKRLSVYYSLGGTSLPMIGLELLQHSLASRLRALGEPFHLHQTEQGPRVEKPSLHRFQIDRELLW